MKEFSSVLRIQGAANHYDELIVRFGKEICSIYRAGTAVGEEFSFAPIKEWPGDVLLVAPEVNRSSGMSEQIDIICDKLEQNKDALQTVLTDGGSIEISCACNSNETVGDFSVSAEQVKSLSKFRARIFFRYVAHEIFA